MNTGYEENMDILQDFLARLAFVGIFIVENVLHAIHFEFEVDNMVIPAVKPLPYAANLK